MSEQEGKRAADIVHADLSLAFLVMLLAGWLVHFPENLLV